MKDLNVSVAACLTASALNIGYGPVVKKGVEALERGRLSHVAQTYLSAETFSLANAPLIAEQAKSPFAQALGGGLVAAIDGMRWSCRSTSRPAVAKLDLALVEVFLEFSPLGVTGRAVLVVGPQLAAPGEMGLVVADEVFLEDRDVTAGSSKIEMSK